MSDSISTLSDLLSNADSEQAIFSIQVVQSNLITELQDAAKNGLAWVDVVFHLASAIKLLNKATFAYSPATKQTVADAQVLVAKAIKQIELAQVEE
jgi:hypothetical protein